MKQLSDLDEQAKTDSKNGKPIPTNYISWVERNWSSRGNPLDLGKYTGGKHRYLEQIYADQSKEIVFMKSAQAGLTERMITEALWLADNFAENSLYIFPTSSAMGDVVQERIDDPINNSPYLSEVSGRSKKLMGKQADKTGLKKMSKGFVYFRGAQDPKQVISTAADAVFADEVDRMSEEIIPFFRARLKHSKRKWLRWASTPTIANTGIDKKFQESDQHYLHLGCQHCGEDQVLDFWKNIDCDREILMCVKCKKEIKPWECELNWIPKFPERKIRGYHISQLYSPLLDVSEVVEESKKEAEWEKMQFFNQTLGLCYEPKGGRITEEDLDACKRDYIIPYISEYSFMGVDVGTMFNVVIMDNERLLHQCEVRTVDELVDLAKDFNSMCAVIDGNPEGRAAEEFATRAQGLNHLCYYTTTLFSKGEWYSTDEMKVTTGRTMSLDKSNNIIKKQQLLLPKNLDDYVKFKTQVKSMTRIVRENNKGDAVAEYIKAGADHYRHALNYANLAKEIYNSKPIPECWTV